MAGVAAARRHARRGRRMTKAALAADPGERLAGLLEPRTQASDAFFEEHAEAFARLCHLMAERFARGGRLIALGARPAARSDARHVAVEFVHPVIVGKRALPAIGMTGGGGELAAQVALLARPEDIAIAFGADEDGGEAARARGARPRAGMPDDRVLAGRRRIRVRAAERGPAHPPGTRRDALPRAVGARACVLRAPRAARRARRRVPCTTPARRASSTRSSPSRSTSSSLSLPTCASR